MILYKFTHISFLKNNAQLKKKVIRNQNKKKITKLKKKSFLKKKKKSFLVKKKKHKAPHPGNQKKKIY